MSIVVPDRVYGEDIESTDKRYGSPLGLTSSKIRAQAFRATDISIRGANCMKFMHHPGYVNKDSKTLPQLSVRCRGSRSWSVKHAKRCTVDQHHQRLKLQ